MTDNTKNSKGIRLTLKNIHMAIFSAIIASAFIYDIFISISFSEAVVCSALALLSLSVSIRSLITLTPKK